MSKNEITKQETSTITITMEQAKALNNKLQKLNIELMKKGFAMCAPLHEMAKTNGYSLLGFQNIYDYAVAMLGRSRGATSQYIQLAERFFTPRKNNPELRTNSILPKYKDFSVTQLVEIRQIDDKTVDELGITPETKVKDIREKVAAFKNQKALENKIDAAINKHNRDMKKVEKETGNTKPADYIKHDDKEAREEFENEILTEEAKKKDLSDLRKEVSAMFSNSINAFITKLNADKLNEILNGETTISVMFKDVLVQQVVITKDVEEVKEA